MASRIEMDPVTRIEGHAKITLQMNDNGEVEDARLHITQFRGFEKFCEGRPHHEMPSLMARICGICPVSHLMASAKACDALMAVQIPPTAVMLRKLMNLAQIVQSHALSFFHLSSPDLLLGLDSDPAKRNIFGVAAERPEIARDGIRLRQFGQEIIELLGGKRIHPAWVVPGGVSEPLTAAKRDIIQGKLEGSYAIILRTLDWYRGVLPKFQDEIRHFGNFPSLYMGLLSEDGAWEHYDGKLHVIDAAGKTLVDGLEPARYADIISEAVEDWSYLKFPFFKPMGYPNGIYRVGPLARLNVARKFGTPRADSALGEFKKLDPGPVASSFHQHYARLIEILGSIEQMEKLLSHAQILDPHVRAFAGPNEMEGIGVSEAPRGTLIHHYKIDKNGVIRWANLIIATGHNNLAMNRGILQAGRHYVKGKHLQEGMLNRVEAVIRSYDPCLSCSTHAIGHMPLRIQLLSPSGEILDQLQRHD